MTPLTCPSCGKQLLTRTRFCPECGTRLADAEPHAPPTGAAEQSAPPAPGDPRGEQGAPEGRQTLFWGLLGGVGCLSVVLVAACALGAVILLGRAAAPPTAAPPTPATARDEGPRAGAPSAGATPLLTDDFDRPAASGMEVDEDGSLRFAYEDGAYVIAVKEPDTLVWSPVDGDYSDARVAVDTAVPPGSDIAAAGLIFHYQDPDNFYLFRVSNDGYYALELLENNEWVVLIDWTPSDTIDARRNRLLVSTRGSRIALSVNDELLETTSDDTFTAGGVALAATSLEDSTAEVRFDNLLIERNE